MFKTSPKIAKMKQLKQKVELARKLWELQVLGIWLSQEKLKLPKR